MPPVTNTSIPALWAKIMVPLTVVAPFFCLAMTKAKSLREVFTASCPIRARPFSCSSSRPMCGTPSRTAMVAGTAPFSRTTCSTCLAVSKFCGYGMPCVMMVDSRATTGMLCANACSTSWLNAKCDGPATHAVPRRTCRSKWRGGEPRPCVRNRPQRARLAPCGCECMRRSVFKCKMVDSRSEIETRACRTVRRSDGQLVRLEWKWRNWISL
mmetsp:Transcript_7748/g.48069  ORF Transcript_7748/g.48069 Transcript_7748/m.48069 type:complete len:212 (+) Transcript_7748:634-1269(+)